ncbi:preQ(0) biosynthesis protein QueC [Humitalea rosea]|uniref:7-cyano-7-deazaguanine synthase n=1 Tax=Humitalea rosea TaxID=990373 RepID=A0A2W7K3E0_9PROT|nr:7-cyano-7-deazaguanine synthase QueC [Humitalea rosea]PZW42140.1 preQ(0) biosynthesis protein QueC [Humitalea rosea]
MKAALVLFSGGQDSATCLAWALDRFEHVETLGFDYGQRHVVELACRDALRAGMAGPGLGPDHTLAVPTLADIGGSALTEDAAIAMRADGLPNTFVPGRNILFLTLAAALAARRGIRHLVTGVCETDYSGYPDCRDDTIKSVQVTLNLGMQARFVIHTPLMWRDKAATWMLAEELGGAPLVALINTESHSCYLGDRTHRHPWGFGCGTCPACDLRARGWAQYVASAPV